MINKRRLPLILSITLHLLLLVILIVTISYTPKKQPLFDEHIFELSPVTVQENSIAKTITAKPIAPPPAPITQAIPVQENHSEVLKTSPTQKQKIEPLPQTAEISKPAPLVPQKEPVSSIIKETPERNQTMTKADFDRLNPKQNKQKKNTDTKSTVSKKPDYVPVKTNDLKKDLQNLLETNSGSAKEKSVSIETLALENYKRAIKPRIERAWQKPAHLLLNNPSAIVQFDLLSSGKIINLRVIKSSGDTYFDNSVLKAFRLVSSLGKVPYNQSLKQLKLTFEIR